MMSFGQRLKMLRREADLSQADLAEAVGVSVYSVSKWECDSNMPDVSLLLPISAVLGVSADCLLGAGTNEKEDFDKYKAEKQKLIDSPWKPGKDNKWYLIYKIAVEYLKKYPLNYEVKYEAATYLYWYISEGTKEERFEMPMEEVDELWDEGVKMLLSIKQRDNDPSRLINVCEELVQYYILKDKWSEAESAALDLPNYPYRTKALYDIACGKRDFEEAEELAEMMAEYSARNYHYWLLCVATRISIFGNARKEEAIAAYRNVLDNAYEYEKLYANDPVSYSFAKRWQIGALAHISGCYIAIDRLDDALDCTERVADIAVEVYKKTKQDTSSDPKVREKELSNIKYYPLVWCYNDVFSDDDNILTREERFKACKARIDALE